MKYIKSLEYVFENCFWEKQIGEITGIRIVPQIEFTLSHNQKDLWCRLEYHINDWYLNIVNENKVIKLSCLEDIYWNSEAIDEEFKDVMLGCKLAGAINEIYEKNRDVL